MHTKQDARLPIMCCINLQVDLKDGSGLAECFEAMHPLAAVINTAAVTSPVICERHPDTARYSRVQLCHCQRLAPPSKLSLQAVQLPQNHVPQNNDQPSHAAAITPCASLAERMFFALCMCIVGVTANFMARQKADLRYSGWRRYSATSCSHSIIEPWSQLDNAFEAS